MSDLKGYGTWQMNTGEEGDVELKSLTIQDIKPTEFETSFYFEPSNEALEKLLLDPLEPSEIFLYAPADLPWHKRLINWLLRRPWPDELIYSGKVMKTTITDHQNPPDAITATITAEGKFKIK